MTEIRRILKHITYNNRIFYRTFTKRKFPIDPDHEKLLPVYKYPVAKQSDNRVYAWGLADTGALGVIIPSIKSNTIRTTLHTAMFPKRLTFAEYNNVKDISCGYGFTIFTVKDKDKYQVYGTGINTDSQFGFHAPRRDHPLEFLLTPVPIHLTLMKDTKITGISAGRAHVVILTDKEGAYTLGNNSYGQCGRRIIENEDYGRMCTIHNIRKINGENIIQVKTGQDHSMFITESGKVYACGWGSDGQLGNGTFRTDYKIGQIKGDIEGENIIKLACAADCILALNDKGEVFGWGNTEYGQLNINHKNEHQVNMSRNLDICNNLGKIIDIASSGSYCVVLNENGDLFTWGYGILGVGPKVMQSTKPLPIPPTLFYNDFNTGSKLTQITSGLSHTAAIMSNGELFMWGRNKHGCLGLGHEKDQFFPLRTSVGSRVVKLACGVDHTIALTKPFV